VQRRMQSHEVYKALTFGRESKRSIER